MSDRLGCPVARYCGWVYLKHLTPTPRHGVPRPRHALANECGRAGEVQPREDTSEALLSCLVCYTRAFGPSSMSVPCSSVRLYAAYFVSIRLDTERGGVHDDCGARWIPVRLHSPWSLLL
jgi:hypothetical protein